MVKISSYRHTILRRCYGRNLNGLGFRVLSPSLVCTLLNVEVITILPFISKYSMMKKNIIQSLQPGFSFKTTIKPKRTLSKFNGKTLHAAAVVVNIFYSLVFSSAKRDFFFFFRTCAGISRIWSIKGFNITWARVNQN